MKLLERWRQFTRPRADYSADAIALFTRFSQRHGLAYVPSDVPVEVMWEFPVQKKLVWPITLGLQNADELNFGVPGFWSYFFPFPSIAAKFESYIDAWVLGEARIVRHPGRFRITSSTDLEMLTDGKWTKVYGGYGDPWDHPTLMIRNL